MEFSYSDWEYIPTTLTEEKDANTPYDDAFRTMMADCRRLLIPLINEAFGKNYTGEEEILPHPNEHFINQQDGGEEKRITDSSFTIIGETRDKYILECQSTPDNTLLVRMYEYITQEALDSGEIIENSLYVTFPHAAILFLRSNSNTSDKMCITMDIPGDCIVSFDIPVIRMSDYTLDEIVRKKLYFLLPFYIFAFEDRFAEYNENEVAFGELEDEYRKFIDILEEGVAEGRITVFNRMTILEMSKRVLNKITKNYVRIREGVNQIMGGRVLEYEAKSIYRSGWISGEIKGETRGEIKGAIRLYHEEMNLPADEIIVRIMKRYSLDKHEAERYVEIVMGMDEV